MILKSINQITVKKTSDNVCLIKGDSFTLEVGKVTLIQRLINDNVLITSEGFDRECEILIQSPYIVIETEE